MSCMVPLGPVCVVRVLFASFLCDCTQFLASQLLVCLTASSRHTVLETGHERYSANLMTYCMDEEQCTCIGEVLLQYI